MWTLQTSWYELLIRGTSIYFFMFIILRIWGKKHLGEMTAFDFILLLFMSEAVQNSLIDDDKSIWGGMIVIATFIFWNVIINKLGYRSRKLEKILDGVPKVLIKDGKLFKETMEKEQITFQELYGALREEGVLDIKDVKQATIETNGHISIVQET
jgi:uncharacterized membrane protein YcaP (DUF421 family)